MSNKEQKNRHYDHEERTFNFGAKIINMAKALPRNQVNLILSNQIIRSGTSIGANYCEANETSTKKDFKFKIGICRKEAKETIYWLKLIIHANPELKEKINPLIQEATELMKIFGAILEKVK